MELHSEDGSRILEIEGELSPLKNMCKMVMEANMLYRDNTPSDIIEMNEIIKNFNRGNGGIDIAKDKVDEFKEYFLNNPNFNINLYTTIEKDGGVFKITYIEDESLFHIRLYEFRHQAHQPFVNVFFNDYKLDFYTFLLNNIVPFSKAEKKESIEIKNLYLDSNDSIKELTINKTLKDYENLNANFYPYLNLDNLFLKYHHSNSNILLICGIPGIGKTRLSDFYGRWLLENKEKLKLTNISGANVKNENLLSKDEFWNDLITENYNFLLLDDIDILYSRSVDRDGFEYNRNKIISNLLSFTEGIYNDNTNKTKIIITTNKRIDEIDEAIIRKGRTFDILELQPLSLKEAKMLWNLETNEAPYPQELEKEEVLQCDLSEAINNFKFSKDYGNIDYNRKISLLEDKQKLQKRKIGF